MSEEEKPSTSKNSTATGSSDAAADAETTIIEYNVRVVNDGRKYNIMRFDEMQIVDFTKWRDVTMERENNLMESSAGAAADNMPEYGEDSEYNRDERHAARRRKKYGTTGNKKYRPEDQTWLLNVGGENGKKYKGRPEGGVNANADYYIIELETDDTVAAHPVHAWYDFQPTERYKSLTSEEAEQEFVQRKKNMNCFRLMLRNRLKRYEEEQDAELDKVDDDDNDANEDSGDDEIENEMTLPEMYEWMTDTDEQPESEEENIPKMVKKFIIQAKTQGDGNEAFEESDDGDEDGKEIDYGSESSEGDVDQDEKCYEDLKGVSEEIEDEDHSKSDDSEKKSLDDGKKGDTKKDKNVKNNKKNKKNKKNKNNKKNKKNKKEDNVDDSSDSENDITETKGRKKTKKTRNIQNKRKSSGTPGGNDATAAENTKSSSAKKRKHEVAKGKKECGITEEAVRRYLMRKPLTAAKLVSKFKKKRGNLSNEQLLKRMSRILKKINPTQQTIQGKLYLSLKDEDKNNKK